MLDETDLRILQLLAEDARRPYSEIGERVDLSGPAVSDRIQRLEELGVIRRFTLDIDRSQLREGTPVLVTIKVDPTTGDRERDRFRKALLDHDGVEDVFVTADARVVIHAHAPTTEVRSWLLSAVDSDSVRDVEVRLLAGADRTADVGSDAGFALTCVECGNDVGTDGVTRRIGGDLKQFCCPSCETLYVERYQEIAEGAE